MQQLPIHDGLMIERLPCGGVFLTKCRSEAELGTEPEWEILIQPAAWASIVAHVSKSGNTIETWEKALRVHEGKET